MIAFGSASVDAFSVVGTMSPWVRTTALKPSIQSASRNIVDPARRFELWSRSYTTIIVSRRMAEGADADAGDPNEVIGRRIIVTGDVNGGYLRTCISNEAGKFRRLLGTMSPPGDDDEAEIYVEVRAFVC